MKENKRMREIIYFLTNKYKGNWELIYNAIQNREIINLYELNNQKWSEYDFISIIDDNYPDNFKKIYMPPLSLFISGNKNLLTIKKIISIWGEYNLECLKQFLKENKKDIAYAFRFKSKDIKLYQELNKAGYALILIDDDKATSIKTELLKQLENYCYLTEFPYFIDKIDKDSQQNFERLLLGVSNMSLIINPSKDQFQKCNIIHHFEKRKLFVWSSNSDYINNQNNIKLIENFEQICIN